MTQLIHPTRWPSLMSPGWQDYWVLCHPSAKFVLWQWLVLSLCSKLYVMFPKVNPVRSHCDRLSDKEQGEVWRWWPDIFLRLQLHKNDFGNQDLILPSVWDGTRRVASYSSPFSQQWSHSSTVPARQLQVLTSTIAFTARSTCVLSYFIYSPGGSSRQLKCDRGGSKFQIQPLTR